MIKQTDIKKYIKLRDNILNLSAQFSHLRDALVKQFIDENLKKLKTEYGDFIVVHRPRYQYSPIVNDLLTRLEKAKRIEELQGVAKIVSSKDYLVVR